MLTTYVWYFSNPSADPGDITEAQTASNYSYSTHTTPSCESGNTVMCSIIAPAQDPLNPSTSQPDLSALQTDIAYALSNNKDEYKEVIFLRDE
ncbi:hypothetical protein GCM10027516_29950 [Niabella aquatica]